MSDLTKYNVPGDEDTIGNQAGRFESADIVQSGPAIAQTISVDDFAQIPDEMRMARRWLVYKLIQNADKTKKPRKVPFYADGSPRSGTLDSPADRARLSPLAEAVAALQTGRYAGLGFALGPDGVGRNWQGIDFDGLSKRPDLAILAGELPGYTETSPSGDGVHAVGYGRQCETLGSNASGIEAYSKGRFFTVTGTTVSDGPIVCLATFIETRLRPLHHVEPVISIAALGGASGIYIDEGTKSDLRSALMALRADYYDLWVRMGLALKELGEAGRMLWMEWSSQSGKFDAREAAVAWDSFQPERIGYQSVFYEAQKHGWVNTRSGEPVLVEAPGNTNKGFAFISAGELTQTPTPVSYLIDEIMENESLCLLFAPPSAGKSFVAISMTAAIATGTDWLGRNTQQGSVFYLAGEGHAGLARRLKAWEVHHES